jgi:lipopolysaccharide export LptBFGC system permease protein LptF
MKLLLQRYLAAQFILPLVVSTVFFICFLLTFELFRLTELLVTRDISLWFIVKLVGNIALTFVPLSLPIAVFFSTIYCLNRLSGDSEYIAMRAGGLTKARLLTPFLLVAGLLAASVYQLNQTVIPLSNKAFRQKVTYLTSSGLLAGIKEGQFFTAIPGITLFAGSSTKYGRNLAEVFLHVTETETEAKAGKGKESVKTVPAAAPAAISERVIFAERGELLFERSPERLSEKLTLTLYDGNIVGSRGGSEVEKILFRKYVFPISQKQFEDQFSIKETMLTSAELEEVLTMTEAEALKAYDFNKKEFFNARYEYWNRKNGALICFVFCFLGFTLGVTGNRGKSKNSGLLGLLCLLVYYGLYFSLVSVAKKEAVPIPVAVFLPVTLIAGLGACFYRKLDWQS